jgi:hypothetical protein
MKDTQLTMLSRSLFGAGLETPLFLKRQIYFCWPSCVLYIRSFGEQRIGRLRKKRGNRKQRRRAR